MGFKDIPRISEEIMKILVQWRIWISLFLIIAPGMLYQIDYKSVNIADYNGLAVIPFFIISLYYCLPYLFLAFILTTGLVIASKRKKKKFKESDLLLIGVYTSFFYFAVTYMQSVIFLNLYLIYLLMILTIALSLIIILSYAIIYEKIRKKRLIRSNKISQKDNSKNNK